MTPFSPGLVQGCFELLEMASRQRLPYARIAVEFPRIGVMPSSAVVGLAQELNWLYADMEGFAALTVSGERLKSFAGFEARVRQALLDYIDIVRPAWVQNASFGRARVIQFCGSDIAQVFFEAGLTHGTEKHVVEFWDELAARARGQRGAKLNATGRKGERLTIAHEKARTGCEPQWVALDNNADGYDILSVVDGSDKRLLSIEVKTTTLGMEGSFHLTANEWDRALFNDLHAFHLWDISAEHPLLAVLTKNDVDPHMPTNQGEGQWESVEIPFGAFAGRFSPQPSLQLR